MKKKVYSFRDLEKTPNLFEPQVIKKEQIIDEIISKKSCIRDLTADHHLIEIEVDYKDRIVLKQYPLTKLEELEGTYKSFYKNITECLNEYINWLKPFDFKKNELKEDGTIGVYPEEEVIKEEDTTSSLFDY